MRNISEIEQEFKRLSLAEAKGDDVSERRTALIAEAEQLAKDVTGLGDVIVQMARATKGGSRFAGPGASKEVAEHLAKGGTIGPGGQLIVQPHVAGQIGQAKAGGLAATMTKALAEGTGSAGGVLVPQDVADEVLGLVRARSAVMAMNPKVTKVRKELVVNSMSTGAAAGYTAENARLPVSEPTFAQEVKLRPKDLGVLVPVSDRLLRDAAQNPDVEQLVREDLEEAMALRDDLAFLEGPGTSNSPLGLRNQPNTTAGPNLGTNGATPTFDQLKATVAGLRAVNAPFRNPGWLFNPRLLATLEQIKDSTGRYLADAGLLTFDTAGQGGTLLGYKFRTTAQIPTDVTKGSSSDTSYLVFSSDWDTVWIGENLALQIDASNTAPYSADGTTWNSPFQNRQTVFRAQASHDIGLVRPQFVTLVDGLRP